LRPGWDGLWSLKMQIFQFTLPFYLDSFQFMKFANIFHYINLGSTFVWSKIELEFAKFVQFVKLEKFMKIMKILNILSHFVFIISENFNERFSFLDLNLNEIHSKIDFISHVGRFNRCSIFPFILFPSLFYWSTLSFTRELLQ